MNQFSVLGSSTFRKSFTSKKNHSGSRKLKKHLPIERPTVNRHTGQVKVWHLIFVYSYKRFGKAQKCSNSMDQIIINIEIKSPSVKSSLSTLTMIAKKNTFGWILVSFNVGLFNSLTCQECLDKRKRRDRKKLYS